MQSSNPKTRLIVTHPPPDVIRKCFQNIQSVTLHIIYLITLRQKSKYALNVLYFIFKFVFRTVSAPLLCGAETENLITNPPVCNYSAAATFTRRVKVFNKKQTSWLSANFSG
jgi:hypothetical protein